MCVVIKALTSIFSDVFVNSVCKSAASTSPALTVRVNASLVSVFARAVARALAVAASTVAINNPVVPAAKSFASVIVIESVTVIGAASAVTGTATPVVVIVRFVSPLASSALIVVVVDGIVNVHVLFVTVAVAIVPPLYATVTVSPSTHLKFYQKL